jgi:hypothetical protein
MKASTLSRLNASVGALLAQRLFDNGPGCLGLWVILQQLLGIRVDIN